MSDLEKIAQAIENSAFGGDLSQVQVALSDEDYCVFNGIYEALENIARSTEKMAMATERIADRLDSMEVSYIRKEEG